MIVTIGGLECISLLRLRNHHLPSFFCIFQTDEFYFKTKFTYHEFDHFRIKTLVDRYHDTEVHTLPDHIGKAYIHQVGEFAYGYKLSYLQLVVNYIIAQGFSAASSRLARRYFAFRLLPRPPVPASLACVSRIFSFCFLIDFFVFALCRS
jgi:hypothetical protein